MPRSLIALLAVFVVALTAWRVLFWSADPAEGAWSSESLRRESVESAQPERPESSGETPALPADSRTAVPEAKAATTADDPGSADHSILVIQLMSSGRPLPGCTVRAPGEAEARVAIDGEFTGSIGLSDGNGEVTFQVPASSTIAVEVAPFGLDVFERWSLSTAPADTTKRATILVAPTALDWMDLFVIEQASGAPVIGADVLVQVGASVATRFEGRSGPNGVARIPVPRRGSLKVTKSGFAPRQLEISSVDAPAEATLALNGTISVQGQIPVDLVHSYDWAEIRYTAVKPVRSRDNGIERIAPAELQRKPRVTFMAEGRINSRGHWEITDAPLPPGTSAAEILTVCFVEELEADFLDDELVDREPGRGKSRRHSLQNERRHGLLWVNTPVVPGPTVSIPFPVDRKDFSQFDPAAIPASAPR